MGNVWAHMLNRGDRVCLDRPPYKLMKVVGHTKSSITLQVIGQGYPAKKTFMHSEFNNLGYINYPKTEEVYNG